jgi:uncharacterized protein
MANWSDPRMTAGAAAASTVGTRDAAFDAGLRSYMLSVYNYMASGVLLTGIVAMLFANSDFGQQIMMSPLRFVVVFAPLAMIFFFNESRSESTLKVMFWTFATLIGMSLSTVFLVYTNTSIAMTFFSVAAAFAGLSLYGYTTKRDLSGFGTFLIMGVIGLFAAMLINLGIAVFTGQPSSTLQYVISFVGVLLFAGLTAYDTQKIKSLYAYVAGTEMMGKTVILGALSLYLDFINMFTFLLQLVGDRR